MYHLRRAVQSHLETRIAESPRLFAFSFFGKVNSKYAYYVSDKLFPDFLNCVLRLVCSGEEVAPVPQMDDAV